MDLRSLMDTPGREGIVRLKLPLPFPLRYVNSYLLEGPTGWTVIDPGLRTPEAEEVWRLALDQLGLAPTAIEQIVLTHHHPDHIGLAGWLQELSGAPVRISAKGWNQAERMWGASGSPGDADMLQLLLSHGMEEHLRQPMAEHLAGFHRQVAPLPHVDLLTPGAELAMGGERWRMIETNGHAWGHLCFYEQGREELICGDHVLPRITPNISYSPGTDPNPLASFLEALRRIGRLEAKFAYPGHRDPFSRVLERSEELIRHHRERLERMLLLLAESAEPIQAYGLALRFFGKSLTQHTLRFAIAETLAHLIYLEQEGRVEREERQGMIFFAGKRNG